MKYFYLIFACLLVACANGVSDDPCVSTDDPADVSCYKSQLIRVFVEDSFSEERKIELTEAFGQWMVKTESRVRFDISFVPVKALKEDHSIANTYFVYNRAPKDPQFAGYTVWSDGAVIELSPKINENAFVPVAMHEIGHALGLGHYTGSEPSIMNSSLRNGYEISCVDIKAFCKEWDCEIACD